MTWLPRDPSYVGLDPSDYTDGQFPTLDSTTGLFAPSSTTDLRLVSPDGTVWVITIDNTGTLITGTAPALLTEAGDTLVTEAGDRLLLEA